MLSFYRVLIRAPSISIQIVGQDHGGFSLLTRLTWSQYSNWARRIKDTSWLEAVYVCELYLLTFLCEIHDLECIRVNEHCSRHDCQVSLVAVAWILTSLSTEIWKYTGPVTVIKRIETQYQRKHDSTHASLKHCWYFQWKILGWITLQMNFAKINK